jgi:hypothetical protein
MYVENCEWYHNEVTAVFGVNGRSWSRWECSIAGEGFFKRAALDIHVHLHGQAPEVIIIIHLLGLAPAGYLTAPDNGPWAGCGIVQVKASVDALCH